MNSRLNISNIYLSIYSFGYSAGFIKNNHIKNQFDNIFHIDDLISLTTELGLGGIEIPLDRYFPDPKHDSFDELMNSPEFQAMSDDEQDAELEQLKRIYRK